MFLKGLCAKGLVLSVAVLKRGGAFKRRGSVGGLGSRELCIPRRSQEAGIFLFRSYLSHKVRCCSAIYSQPRCTASPQGWKQWGPIPTTLWAQINFLPLKVDCLKDWVTVTGSWLTHFVSQDSLSRFSQEVFPLLYSLEMETCELNSQQGILIQKKKKSCSLSQRAPQALSNWIFPGLLCSFLFMLTHNFSRFPSFLGFLPSCSSESKESHCAS